MIEFITTHRSKYHDDAQHNQLLAISTCLQYYCPARRRDDGIEYRRRDANHNNFDANVEALSKAPPATCMIAVI